MTDNIRRRLQLTFVPDLRRDGFAPIVISVAVSPELAELIDKTPVVAVNYELQLDLQMVNPKVILPTDGDR